MQFIDEAIGIINTEIYIIRLRIKYPEQFRTHFNTQPLSPLYLADKTNLSNLYITTMQHNRMNIPANTLYRSTKCFERVSYVHASSIESLNKYNYTFQRSLCILLRLQ